MSRELQLEEWSIMGASRDLYHCWVQEHKGSFPEKVAWMGISGNRKEAGQSESRGPEGARHRQEGM